MHGVTPGTQLLAFIATLKGSSVPPAVHDAVAQHVLEILAGICAGVDIPEMQPLLQRSARSIGNEVLIPATGVRCELSVAAGVAAALSHAAEADPIHLPTIVCPALLTIPTALALAQTETVDGLTFVAAVTAGYEMAIRVGAALNTPQLLALGWWPTAVCGTVAAATTAALCMRLDERGVADAIGLAGVLSGGLGIGGAETPVARNLLCAHTVTVGVQAAMAARDGIAGPRQLFAGERNFVTAFARTPDTSQVDAGLGSRWGILETSLKQWPCALQAQTSLDALSQIVAMHGPLPDVVSVEVRMPSLMARIVDRSGAPATRFAAAASIQFLCAALLIDGDILEQRLQEEGCLAPDVNRLMQNVKVLPDAQLDRLYPEEWPARVTVTTVRGTFSAESALPPGHPAKPLSLAASAERFRRSAERRLTQAQTEAAIAFVGSLASRSDMSGLVDCMATQVPPSSATLTP